MSTVSIIEKLAERAAEKAYYNMLEDMDASIVKMLKVRYLNKLHSVENELNSHTAKTNENLSYITLQIDKYKDLLLKFTEVRNTTPPILNPTKEATLEEKRDLDKKYHKIVEMEVVIEFLELKFNNKAH